MDRLIKFRGKNMGGDWIYGGYGFSTKNPKVYITAHRAFFLVKPETVGEFTGFKDIDENEIFEGDIIQNDAHEEEIYKIITTCGCWCGLISGGDIDDYDDTPTLGWLLDMAPFKVIGNIHDNPELLEGGK